MTQQPQIPDEEVILVLPNGSELVSTKARAAQDWAVATGEGRAETKPPRNWGSAEQLGNAWESAKANLNPVSIAKGVFKLAKGVSDTFDVVSPPTQDEANLRNMPGAMVDSYKSAYGGWENIKDTLYNDPFRVAMDATILTGPAGAGAKAAGMGRTANVISKAGALADVPGQAVRLAAKPVQAVGRAAIQKSISPPISIVQKMAESRTATPKEMRRYLGDLSYDKNLPPTGGTVRTIWDQARSNVLEEGGMVDRASAAGRTQDMRSIASDTAKSALSYTGEGHVIPKVRAYTRPNAAIAETKAKIGETFTQHPDMSVPYTDVREPILTYDPFMPVMDDATGAMSTAAEQGVTTGTGAPFNAVETRIPNPALDPRVLRDVTQGTNAKLRYSYGVNAPSDVEKVVDKAFAHHSSDALDNLTAGFEATPGRTRAVVDKETHDIINLADAIVNRSYTSQQAPFKLWEMMGGLAGEPAVVAAGTLTRPPVMWTVGKGMRKASDHATAASKTALDPALVRAALAAKLGQGQ